MTNLAPGYPLPRSDDEFERLCLKLLRRHWQLPQLERFRDPDRAGKGINLIEISGRPRLAAVKCDLRAARNELTVAEIKDAVALAASLKLPIGRFVIATTAARPEGLQRSLFDLNRANRKDDISAIEVLTWDDIEELLDEYPQVLTDFGTAAKRQALTRADAAVHLDARCELAAGPADALGEEISAAAALLESRQYQLARLALLRLREQKWSQLSNVHKFRVLSYLGAAWLKEGEPRKSAMLFIAAKSLQPEEENACTNEALAHELLGERERAFVLADKLRMQFPSSGRAVALWLNNAPKSLDAKSLEADVAPELASDPEVAVVVARRALLDANFDRAEHYARLASTALPNNSIGWLVLGQSILLNELEDRRAGATDAPAPAHGDESRVREAETCFTQALTLAQNEHLAPIEVRALIGRAQARIALRDTDGAGKDIEQAHGLGREDANGLCEYGIVLLSRGSLTEAIEVLRRAASVGGRDDAGYHLAITLRERDEPGDLQEATELLIRAISRPESIPDGDFPFAVASAVEALSMAERYHDADALLSSIPDARIPKVTMQTLRANLRLAQGKFDQASKCADAALSALAPDTAADNRRKLAALLHDLGRYRDALALWQMLAASGGAGTDTRRLLDCASRLGREDIVNEIASRLHPESAIEAGAVAGQLEKLERDDPEAALAGLEELLREHSEDRVLRLRRSIVAARLGKVDLVVADPNAMPPAREIPPALGRAAVQFMRDGGRANEALAYAYELIRRQGASVDSHRAYLAAVGPVGPIPHVPDFDTAGPGAALSFVEEGSATERWILLEESNDADESLEEYGPQHPMSRALKGKRVGEKFQLPEGRLSRRQAAIKHIISKYAYRYMDVLVNWQTRFPGQTEIEMSCGRATVIPWSEMHGSFESLFEASNGAGNGNGIAHANGIANGNGISLANGHGIASGKREDLVKQAQRTYAGNPIPIHAVAERISLNDLQTVFILAQCPETPLKCSTGSPEELEAALGAFERANAVVLDLTAIATLCMLGRLSLLPTWPRQFVISQSTLAELRRLAFEDNLLRLPPGFSASLTGNGKDGKRADVQLKGLADALQSVCRVRDGAVLASIDPDRRERLINFFGRHGAESIVIASMPGHVLWTDDMILADLAKTEFGVRRVWTEAALQARAKAGNLDPAELAAASTKLAGWGYSRSTPSIETLMRAGSVAVWNPDQFPLRQALDQFAADSLNMPDAVRLGAELIVKMYNDQQLRGQRGTVTSRLLDRLAARPGGRDAVEALPRSLPIRFGLDLIRARELSDIVRGWTAQNEMQLSA